MEPDNQTKKVVGVRSVASASLVWINYEIIHLVYIYFLDESKFEPDKIKVEIQCISSAQLKIEFTSSVLLQTNLRSELGWKKSV